MGMAGGGVGRACVVLLLMCAVLLGLAASQTQASPITGYHALLGPLSGELVVLLSRPTLEVAVFVKTFPQPCDEAMFNGNIVTGESSAGLTPLLPGDAGQFDGQYVLDATDAFGNSNNDSDGSALLSVAFRINLSGKACSLVSLEQWPTMDNGILLLNGTSLTAPVVAFLRAMDPPENDASDSDACTSGPTREVEGLHVAAIFIILVASILGAVPPIVWKLRGERLPFFMLIGKHVGTGVLIALGIIHLLVPAFETLTDPCLVEYSNLLPADYHFASLFVLLSVLCMHLVEMLAILFLDRSSASRTESLSRSSPSPSTSPGPAMQEHTIADDSSDNNHHNTTLVESDAEFGRMQPQDVNKRNTLCETDFPGHSHGIVLMSARPNSSGRSERRLKETIAAYILEFGLACHSIIIGITLGVSAQDDLPALLCALTFHQFFEGVALGTRLISVPLTMKNRLLLCVIYCLSCPVGVAIGIGASTSFSMSSPNSLLTVGIFECVAAGIILYVALYSMLRDFETDFARRSAAERAALFASLWFGACIMAVLGLWL